MSDPLPTPPKNQLTPQPQNVVEAQPVQFVPYDENLLERARTQWQFGDWQSLAAIERDTLQHHPDRAKLALLAAAGRLQTGRDAEARQLIRLALDWGISKSLVSRILIAGVHNSLGRAAAIVNQQNRALRHFEGAIRVGMRGGDARLITQARTGEQLRQLGLFSPEGYLKVGVGGTAFSPTKLPPLSKSIETLSDAVKQQYARLTEQITRQSAELIEVRKHLEKTVKQEILNATQQFEAFLDIQRFFNNGEQLPPMHGWRVRPDFACYLIELLTKNEYQLILEFGSGTSTVLMAKALARLNRVGVNQAPTQVAFEHLEEYHAQTLSDLQSAHLADSVQLVLAPLEPYQAPNGNTYAYYNCHQQLAELANRLPSAPAKILIVVDGPPGNTGKHARYPALPAVLTYFKKHKIDILLDDYFRDDEKEVVKMWEKDFERSGYEIRAQVIQMEKGACFISGRPK
jgi:hypothetical protein